MPKMYQVGAARYHGLGTRDRSCLLDIRRGLQDLTGLNTRSNIHIRLHDLTGSEHIIVHGFGTPDCTCLEGIRKGLQGLTDKEHQIVNAYEISGPGFRVSRVRDTRSNTPTK